MSEANADQIAYWSEQAGPKWVRKRELLDRQLEALGKLALDAADLKPGERVLDVGCGCAATTLEIARRVGPGGQAVGVDVSEVMLREARKAARGMSNLRFERADAQTRNFERVFDVLTSRFGVMFFGDPKAAFANLRSALVPGGRLAFVCWQPLAKNPWMLAPLGAAAKHVELPAPPPPDAPGPFSFGDADRLRGILTGSGFQGLEIEPVEGELVVGGVADLEGAVEFLLDLGPTAALLKEAGEQQRERVHSAVREALRPHHKADGVHMACATWVVTARNAA